LESVVALESVVSLESVVALESVVSLESVVALERGVKQYHLFGLLSTNRLLKLLVKSTQQNQPEVTGKRDWGLNWMGAGKQ